MLKKISGGKYLLPKFTDKAKVNSYIKHRGFEYTTILMPGFYYQNFVDILPPTRESDNTLLWTIPMSENSILNGFDVRDIGPVAVKVFNDRDNFNRKKIPLVGDQMRPQDFIIKLGLLSRQHVKVQLVESDIFLKQSNQPYAKELIEMFKFISEYSIFGKNAGLGKQVYPEMKTWEQYLLSQMNTTTSQ